MIWLRRALAVILGLVFVLVFLAVLLVTQVNATFGNPQFYIKQLRQADIYNFIYDDLLPVALEKFEIDFGKEGPHYDIPRIKAKALATARQTLPPQWIQAQTERTISTVIPYFLGDTEGFALTVPLEDRVQAASKAIEANMLEREAFSTFYNPTVTWAVDQALANLDRLPYRLTLGREELDSSIRTVVPQDWLVAQANGALDSAVPYFTRESEHFAIRVPLQDRVEAAKTVAIRILGKPETYDFLMDRVVAPAIEQNVGQTVPLPFGIALTQNEVLTAVKGVLPQPWVRERLTDLVNQAALYIEGRSDTVAIVVPLAERKAAALQVISDLADRKLKALFDSLPQCTPQDLARGPIVGGIPVCRPVGMSYEDAKKALGFDVAGQVRQLIGDSIPDQWTFADADLRSALGADNWSAVVKAREQVMSGLTYTDSDLRRDLGQENSPLLEDARGWIASGYTVNQQDLRERMREAGGTTQDPLQSLDEARHWLGLARRWLFLLWALPGLLLVFIGLLGGRNWASKLAWGAVALAVVAAIAVIISGPVYTGLARPELQSALAQATSRTREAVVKLAVDKAATMSLNVADAFVSGIKTRALLALAIAVAGIVVAVVLGRRSAQPVPRQPPEAPSPASTP